MQSQRGKQKFSWSPTSLAVLAHVMTSVLNDLIFILFWELQGEKNLSDKKMQMEINTFFQYKGKVFLQKWIFSMKNLGKYY